jgi:hypothetical protein
VSLPRRCGHQCHRSNVPADTPCEYYWRCLSIQNLYHLLSEMEMTFSFHQQTALLGLSMVPSSPCRRVHDHMYAASQNVWLPIVSKVSCTAGNWSGSSTSENGSASLPTTLSFTLRQVTSMYPQVKALVAIMCTLPVTSCSAKRSFSGLRRSKHPFNLLW